MRRADPFVLDMATTTVALGKVEIRDREERQCPPGWGGNAFVVNFARVRA